MPSRMPRILLALVALALLAPLVGCGGGGGSTPSSPLDGSYYLIYLGSAGAVQFTVNSNQVSGYGIDSSGEKFPVTGSLTASGDLSIGGTGDHGHDYTFSGNLSGTGIWSSTSGDSGTWTGAKTGASGDPGSYAGNWRGTYTGSRSGTWTVRVDEEGLLTGKADGLLDAVGVVTGSGSVHMGTVSFEGALVGNFSGQFTGSAASGIWESAGEGGTWIGSRAGWVIDETLFTPNYVAALDGKLFHWNHLPMTAKFNLPAGWAATYGNTHLAASGEWNSEREMIRVVPGSADVTVEFVDQSDLGGNTYGRTSFTYNSSSGEMLDAGIQIAISDSHGPTAPIDIQALIAHELGHALGIGGHSPNSTDLMYTTHIFGMARPATALDINTIKTAYPGYFGIPMLRSEPTRSGEIVHEVIE